MGTPRPIRRRVAPGAAEVCGQTFDGQVAASADDGRCFGGTFNNSATTIIAGNTVGNVTDLFARIDGVTVPAGATIEAANISSMSISSANDGAATLTNVYLEAADDPAAPTDCADLDGRARTTEFVAWDEFDFPDTTNFYDSDDMTAVIQEVVDRGGWVSGQAMQILWDDDGSGSNKRYNQRSYDDDPTKAIKLHIQYCA